MSHLFESRMKTIENKKLHKHVEILKKQLEERETTIIKLREELGRSGITKWVEGHD